MRALEASGLKFGLPFWLDQEIHLITGLVQRAEKSGFSYAWFPDHYFLRDPFIAQAAAAMRTSRILLGLAVTTPFLRHPAAIASAAASLDELSSGRAILGIGAGSFELPKNLGLETSKPLKACRESVEISRSLWRGLPTTMKGFHFKVDSAKLQFKPNHEIPVYVAGRGSRMLELAGELGDGVITHSVAERYVRFVSERVKVGAEKAGRDQKLVDIAIFAPIAVTKDAKSAKRRLRQDCVIMAGGEFSLDLLEPYGLKKEEVEPLRGEVRKGDLKKASELVTEEMVDCFCIVGTREECLSKIEALRKRGVSQLILGSAPRREDEDVKANIDTIAREIIPYVNP